MNIKGEKKSTHWRLLKYTRALLAQQVDELSIAGTLQQVCWFISVRIHQWSLPKVRSWSRSASSLMWFSYLNITLEIIEMVEPKLRWRAQWVCWAACANLQHSSLSAKPIHKVLASESGQVSHSLGRDTWAFTGFYCLGLRVTSQADLAWLCSMPLSKTSIPQLGQP